MLTSSEFTEGEKFIVRAQYRAAIPMGNFEEKLWELLCAADERNLARLSASFPTEVKATTDWRYGALGYRLREFGLDI